MMRSLLFSAMMFFLVVSNRGVYGQTPPDFPKPTKEHLWLKQFEGDWKTESKGTMGPDQPTMECRGTLKCRSLAGYWIINEMEGDMAGSAMTGIQTIGYDEAKKKYVGTWVDSMNSFMWQYQGTVDESGKILTLEADGPNFMVEGKTTKFQDIYEFKSKDEIIITSKILGEDGKWVTFMEGSAKRTKK